MKSFTVLFYILILAQNSSYGQLAVISANPSSYSFGTVMEGDTLIHQFEIHNSGEVSLTVNGVESNCDCVTAEISNVIIPAGGVAILSTTFFTNMKMGSQKKIVTLLSNGTNPAYKLEIEAEIQSKEIDSPPDVDNLPDLD